MISFMFLPRVDDLSWSAEGLRDRPARTLTADDLTFHYFNADVVINDGQNEIHLRTPGLPVVDFTLMVVQLYRDVMSSGESVVESSQTQDSISAVRRGDDVEISYSFSCVVSSVSLDEFKEMAISALRSALSVLYAAHENLRYNRYLADISSLDCMG